ncbi:metallo-hydrolase family protein [Sphingobium sp. CFD-2]|uniref:metallo-hydrolase family protein n=1 Tax=Sphingobium sp. CFD-2 TaxID=2878542 RepID=UPI00214A9201|nr:metallo-hydrolase family protein [Sphingobium sp. CFD-2]
MPLGSLWAARCKRLKNADNLTYETSGLECGDACCLRPVSILLWERPAHRVETRLEQKGELTLPIARPSRLMAAALMLSMPMICTPASRAASAKHSSKSERSKVPAHPQPPADLLNAMQALGSAFKGEVGIAVRDLDEGWAVSFNGDRLLPQQSVSKLWVAIAVLDAVDRGKLSLSDPVTVKKSDLTLFHQPIRALVTRSGYRTTVGKLLELAMTRSANSCNDVLLWKVGGPRAIRAMLERKGIDDVGFGPGERELQARTAGLKWRPEWAGGWGFLKARAALSYKARDRALKRYLAAPYDGASANGVTLGLALLKKGKLLSARSTRHLLALMHASRTGPLRLGSGLREGWTLAHKTGTGQELRSLSTGYNDVGILVSPRGRRYAVAVMIASTHMPIPARMRLMGNVTRAIIRLN